MPLIYIGDEKNMDYNVQFKARSLKLMDYLSRKRIDFYI